MVLCTRGLKGRKTAIVYSPLFSDSSVCEFMRPVASLSDNYLLPLFPFINIFTRAEIQICQSDDSEFQRVKGTLGGILFQGLP
jgi:hypothetical protein